MFSLLEQMEIPCEAVAHPAVFTVDGMAALRLPHAGDVAKNLFLRDSKKRNYYLLVARAETKVELKALWEKIGSGSLSFASEADLAAIMGLSPGSVSPFGVLNDGERRVTVLLDRAFQGARLGVHPNANTATVWLSTADLVSVIKAHGNPVEFVEL